MGREIKPFPENWEEQANWYREKCRLEREVDFRIDLCLIECANLALESPRMYQPLGVLYLAAVVKQRGFTVKIADLRDGMGDIPEAKFYGFSCTTPEINFAKELSKEVSGKTIVGGAHPSLLPGDCIKDFDYIVTGEGEEAIIDILGEVVDPGIIVAPRIQDLDSIPYPDWDAVTEPFSETLYTGERYGKGMKSASIITSRGCPFKCSFCGNLLRAPVTFRSVSNIIGEIAELGKRGIKYLRFVDDNFTLHKEFEQLTHKLKQCHTHYRCHTRSDLLTWEQSLMLADSGCEECSLGVESADNRVLKINHKLELVEHHIRAITLLKKAGIKVKVYLMAGLPGETDRTNVLNKEFIRETKPEKFTLSTFTPYPGCDIYRNPQNYGVRIINPDWANWWNFVIPVKGKNLPGRAGFVHILDGQSIEEMEKRYESFYSWLLLEEWLS